MNMRTKVAIPVICLAIALSFGCHKKEESAPSAPQLEAQPQAQTQQQPQAGSDFSASLPPALAGKSIVPGGKANLDALNKNSKDEIIKVKSEDGFNVNGWAFDDNSKSAPEMVFVELAPVKGGEKYHAAATRSDRRYLAKTFNEPAYKKSGFNLKADIKSIPPGDYQINIIQIVDGNPILAPTFRKMIKTN